MMKKQQSLNVTNFVHQRKTNNKTVGVYSTDFPVTGWISDRDRFLDSRLAVSRFDTFVGGQRYNLLEGTSISDWNSIVLQDIELKNIQHYRFVNSETWTPVFETGIYSNFWNVLNLFSDFHFSSILKEADDHFYEELRTDCVSGSIECAIWARNKYFLKYPFKKFEYTDSFESSIVNHTGPFRVDTVKSDGSLESFFPLYLDKKHLENVSGVSFMEDSGYISIKTFEHLPGEIFYCLEKDLIAKPVDNSFALYPFEKSEDLERKSFFTIQGNRLVTNKKDKISIGSEEKDKDSIESFWEKQGRANPSGRVLFLKYFPTRIADLEVAATSSYGDVIILKRTENLDYEDDSEYVYQVDEDLGIVKIGGSERVSLTLMKNVEKFDDEIFVYESDYLRSYPETGILEIENEYIFYSGKTNNSFYGCSRGYSGTEIGSYSMDQKIRHRKTGKSINSNFLMYCKYSAVPKIRYEIDSNSKTRHANDYGFLDLRPIRNTKENGIIQISSIDRNVANVEIEIDADFVYADLYGPIYYGNDYKRVTGRAVDVLGNPVKDIEIKIIIKSGPGFLNYSLREFLSISNTEGEIYTLYGVPYDWNSIAKRVIDVQVKSGLTKITIDKELRGISSNSVFLYQVTKDDPILGTDGKKFLAKSNNSWSVLHPRHSLSFFVIDGIAEDIVSAFEGGTVHIVLEDSITNSTVRFERTIAHASSFDAVAYPVASGITNGIVIMTKESIPVAYSNWDFKYAVLFEKEAEVFSKINLNGRRRIVYVWDDDVLHPITMARGAYYPLTPSAIDKRSFTYSKELPLPEPENVDSNIGGYAILCSDIVEMYAECIDPITGNIIRSDTVRARIDIPEYLSGVTKERGLPLPYGFKIISDRVNISSGIGGSTFLTINPFDYNIADLLLEIK